MAEFVFSHAMLADLLTRTPSDTLVRVVTDGPQAFAEAVSLSGETLESNVAGGRVGGCPNPPGCPTNGIAGIFNHLNELNA